MEKSGEDPLIQLRKAIVSQKTAALPDSPGDPSLQELHEQIVAYDRHVSETVIAVLGGGNEADPYPGAADIARQVSSALAGADGTSRTSVMLYQRYAERLDRMLSLAIEVARSRK